MKFCPGIEIGFASRHRRRDSLILEAQCPPCRVVAHICLPGQDIGAGERPIYTFNELPEGPKLRELVDEVVIALRPERLSEIPGIASQFDC